MPINENYILKHIGSDYMIIPTTKDNVSVEKIFNTNEVGGEIYNYLKLNKSVDEIVSLLLKEYDTTKEELEKDVKEFIGELKKRGIFKD